MSSGITLSAGVRQNLLSLQNTATAMATTQNRLATGKKVNSALDNPGSYFTSQSLSNRASDLGNLLDQIGQATSTLQAANQGITSLTSLVNSAKSIATQARQSSAPATTYSNTITGNAIADDTSRAVSTNTSMGTLTASVSASYKIDAAAINTAAATGDTFTIDDGAGGSVKFEKVATSGGTPVASGAIGFSSAAELTTALKGALSGSTDDGSNLVTFNNGSTDLSNATATGTSSATIIGAVTNTASVAGSTFTLTQGSTTKTFNYVASGSSAAGGTFTTLDDLASAINASSIGNASTTTLNAKVHASVDGAGKLVLESAGNNSFTTGGSVGTALGGIASSAAYNSSLASSTGTLSITVGTGAQQDIDFSTIKTKAALNTALGNLTGVTGSITGGNLTLSSTSKDDVVIGGSAASSLFDGANIGTNAATGTTYSNDRLGLQNQYNALLTQIDQLASDSSYNGINLLKSDVLKVTFNETGSSSMSITGVNLDSGGLGLTALSSDEFQSNAQIDTVIGKLSDSLSQLRSQASAFGSTLSTVQTRQDFTTNMINTLQTGSDNLVLADTNLEGANLLALQTRQSLSTTALSMANQSNQAVLRLFG